MDLTHKVVLVGIGDLYAEHIFTADFTGLYQCFDFAFAVGMG